MPFLDSNGVKTLWEKAKETFLDKDDANDKFQSKLVSGTNLKTINGSSLLGSGNLVVTGSSNALYDNDTMTDGDSMVLSQPGFYHVVFVPNTNSAEIIIGGTSYTEFTHATVVAEIIPGTTGSTISIVGAVTVYSGATASTKAITSFNFAPSGTNTAHKFVCSTGDIYMYYLYVS